MKYRKTKLVKCVMSLVNVISNLGLVIWSHQGHKWNNCCLYWKTTLSERIYFSAASQWLDQG